jgi:hypothetical protein
VRSGCLVVGAAARPPAWLPPGSGRPPFLRGLPSLSVAARSNRTDFELDAGRPQRAAFPFEMATGLQSRSGLAVAGGRACARPLPSGRTGSTAPARAGHISAATPVWKAHPHLNFSACACASPWPPPQRRLTGALQNCFCSRRFQKVTRKAAKPNPSRTCASVPHPSRTRGWAGGRPRAAALPGAATQRASQHATIKSPLV